MQLHTSMPTSIHAGEPSPTRRPGPFVLLFMDNSSFLYSLMPAISGNVSAVSGQDVQAPNIEGRFRRLAARWRRETQFMSSINDMVLNESYQKIIGLGATATPLILDEMRVRPDYWFWALRCITGENPVKKNMTGNLRRMTEAWLKWGRKKGYHV